MSTIDKSLPNVEQEIKLPSEEEIVEASQDNIEEQVGPEDIQVEQDEDGGATITFDPEAVNQPGTNEHFDNLADLLPEDVLGRLGSELFENYMQYKASRKDWEDAYTKGLNPTFRKIANLGLGKVGLRALSRAGIVGLAASLGIQGMNLLDD